VVDVIGQVKVGTRSFLDLEAFREHVRERVVDGRTSTVLIQGHREARYADVSRVLDACREAGVPTIGLATAPRVN
jgi:biopolymer transport protein ExbD